MSTCEAPELTERDLTKELWREYEFGGSVHRINDPVTLYYRPGGTTHRVVDNAGVVHCLPAPGEKGCALRWMPRDASEPVQF
jgi:hypothetical protein